MIEMRDRVVFITGAAGAIGSATARLIVQAGGRVLVHDRDASVVNSLVEKLDGSATGLTADLSDANATNDLWNHALAVHGQIDVLINNAGIYPEAPIENSLEDWLKVWDHSLAVNLIAPAVLCRAAIKTFADQPDGGIIINLASRAAFRGEDPDYWHYAAAKAGIVAMTKTIARQYGRDGVTAFAIAPGFVDTAFNRVFAEEFGVDAAAADTGLGEVAHPEDIANVIFFLASGMARHATGTTIDVNGASYVH